MQGGGKYRIVAISFIAVAFALVMFTLSDSTMTGDATYDSHVGNLSASVQTYVACTWSADSLNVDFGNLLNPGTSDINATENYALSPGTGYNVTVDPLTTSNVDVIISGNDLIDGANVLGVGNVTWAANSTDSDGANMIPADSVSLTNGGENLATAEPSGSSVHYRFWLDIPNGVVAGNYVGNYTIQCQEA